MHAAGFRTARGPRELLEKVESHMDGAGNFRSLKIRSFDTQGVDMSLVPDELLYTKDHEWARLENGVATVGVTDHAQRELGDIVFVELPKVGARLKAGESFGTIEAVKTVAELYAPLAGVVTEVNTDLATDAGVVNQDPYGKGWILKVAAEKSENDELMNAKPTRS